MALPDYLEITQSTVVVWGESGGTSPTVTHTLSLNNLATGTARMGASVDLGANYAEMYAVELFVETGTAPTAGNTVELYLVGATDTNYWPGKVTGSDAAYTVGTSDANIRLIGDPPVSVLIATNDGNTTLGRPPVIWRPRARYVVPIFYNKLGQSTRNQTTASNNKSRVVLTMLRSVVNE
jgi:hypothetical protein